MRLARDSVGGWEVRERIPTWRCRSASEMSEGARADALLRPRSQRAAAVRRGDLRVTYASFTATLPPFRD